MFSAFCLKVVFTTLVELIKKKKKKENLFLNGSYFPPNLQIKKLNYER